VIVLAISAVPPFISLNYLRGAYGEWRTDIGRAYSDLDRARSANPLALEPYLAEGAIAREAGQRGRAIQAFTQAAAKRPEEWASHYYLARLYQAKAPRRAAAELALARQLNPNEAVITALQHRLTAQRAAAAGPRQAGKRPNKG